MKGYKTISLSIMVIAATALTANELTRNQTAPLTKEIKEILSDPGKCFSSIGEMNAIQSISQIKEMNGNRFHVLTEKEAPESGYGPDGVKIKSYHLSSSKKDIAKNHSELEINYQLKNKVETSERIKLFVKVDNFNRITTCRALK